MNGRFPTFRASKGVVRHRLGGIDVTLRPGEFIEYKHHGYILVDAVKGTSAKLTVLPPGHAVGKDITIPAKSMLTLVNGRQHVERLA